MRPGALAKAIIAGVGGAVLLLAACAPAAEEEATTTTADATTTTAADTTTTTTTAGTTETTTTAEAVKPAPEQYEAKPEEKASGVETSVTGIPLNPDAQFGGVVVDAESRDGLWLGWERCCTGEGHMPPVSNLIRYRSWGDPIEDVKNSSYLQITPDLAHSWEQSPDGMEYAFHLLDGVTFHDGEPLTCEDVAWSMEQNRTGEQLRTAPRGAHLAAVESFTCPDDLTLVVKMRRPKPSIVSLLAMAELYVLPKHIYDGNVDLARDKPAVGSGPFVAGEWIPGERYSWVRNDEFYDQPFPYLDGIDVVVMRGDAAVTAALRAGRLDYSGDNDKEVIELMKQCDICYETPMMLNHSDNASLIPNFERYPWNLPEVRAAISLGVDRPTLAKLTTGGTVEPTRTGLYLPGSGFEMPYERYKDIPGFDYDKPREEAVAEARALLASVGFQPGDLSTTLEACTVPDWRPDATVLVPMMEEIGIHMEIREADRAVCYQNFWDGNFDVALHGGYYKIADPDGILYEFYYPGSDRNYGRYSNPEVKRLIDLQSQTLDREKRKEMLWDVGETIMRDVVRTFWGFGVSQYFFNNQVHGILPAPAAMRGQWTQHRHTWVDQ